MVAANPDPTSRYPTSYCRTCGGGWPEFMRCARWETRPIGFVGLTQKACDFSGEVPLTAEAKLIGEMFARGEVPAGTRTLGTWGQPKKG